MKTTDRFIKVTILAKVVVLFVYCCFFTGCVSVKSALQADAGMKHSETEFGGGITGLAGKQLSNQLTSIYGLAGYHYYAFNGGHDNFFQVGIQARQALGENGLFWAGGEAGWVHDKSIYKDADWSNPTSNGFFAGALAGYKLPVSALDMSVFTGLSYIRFGDFKADDYVVEEGHNSVQFKLGVNIALPFSE